LPMAQAKELVVDLNKAGVKAVALIGEVTEGQVGVTIQ